MVCPICVGATIAQTAPVVVAALSGATAARMAFHKQAEKRTTVKLARPVQPAPLKASYRRH